MVQGKNSKSYKKKNTSDQQQPHTGFKNLVFGHQFASAGETIIPFNSLVQPSNWPQAGLVNPNAQTLLAAQLQVFKDNITVTSSARGIIQKSEYIVRANAIEFLNIESLVNEVFEVEVADLMITGNLIVDMQTIRIEGELSDTETDFNMGYEFDVLKEEVIVFRDGIQMFRSDNNDSSGTTGNYYYLDSGNGRASVIRFFEPAVGNEAILIATTGGVVDPANVSTFQQIESLQGQLDAVIPTVAALAGVPETNFRVGPNNVDLKQFGDLLIDVSNKVDTGVETVTEYTEQYVANNTKTLYRTKFLSSNIDVTNTTANVPDLQFNNLEIGKTYKITGQIDIVSGGAGSVTGSGKLTVTHNGVQVLVQQSKAELNGANDRQQSGANSYIFTATATTTNVTFQGFGQGILIASNQTFLTLEELPNHEETTQWD